MKAVRCHRYAALDEQGKPAAEPVPLREVLSIDEVGGVECGASQVAIEVHYSGIQYPDALQAMGLYQEKPALPYIPGFDVAGVVQEVGDQVTNIRPGQRVIAFGSTGGLAETFLADTDSVWKAPAEIDLSLCANVGRNYIPAYHSLKVIGNVQAGDLVLADGASGGVGMATVQLAKAMGADVIAAVGSEEKMEVPTEAGADRVLCYGRSRETYRQFKQDVRETAAQLGHPDGVDLIVDVVQGDLFEAALVSTLRPLGKICLVGFAAGQKPIRPGLLLIKQAAVVGSLWKSWAEKNQEAQRRNVGDILGWIAEGTINPRIGHLFEFSDYLKAFELFEQNRGRANTVIRLPAAQQAG